MGKDAAKEKRPPHFPCDYQSVCVMSCMHDGSHLMLGPTLYALFLGNTHSGHLTYLSSDAVLKNRGSHTENPPLLLWSGLLIFLVFEEQILLQNAVTYWNLLDLLVSEVFLDFSGIDI